jgi:hypothetical protein
MTLKEKALTWNAAWKLSNVKPEWWKCAFIAIVFWFSPPSEADL